MIDTTASWANNAAQNTAVNIDAVYGNYMRTAEDLFLLTVTNPSAVTALTVVVKTKATFGGVARYPELTRFGVPVSSTDGYSRLLQGLGAAEAIRITLSNDTALGAADAFTAYVRMKKVGKL